MQLLQQSEGTAAQRRIFFHAVDATDGITAETGLTGTGRITKNGAASAASSGSLVEIDSTNMPGRYYIELTAAELDTLGIIEFRYKAAACAEVVARGQVVPWDPYDAVRAGLTALPNANAEAAGGLYTRGSGAGQINQSANGQVDTNPMRLNNVAQSLLDLVDFADAGYDPATNKIQGLVLADAVTTVNGLAANVITAAATAADFGAEIASAVWQDATAGDFTVASSIGKALYIANIAPGAAGGHFISGSNAGTTTVGALTVTGAFSIGGVSDVAQTGDSFARIGAAGAGLTAITGKTDNLPTDPADESLIIAATDAIMARLGVPLVSVSADIAGIQADTDNLQTRLPAALVGGRIDASVGAMDAGVITAIAEGSLKVDMSSISGEAARSPLNALRFLRNKWEVAAGVLTVMKEDDLTAAWTAAISTDAAAVPVIGSDPV